MRRESRIRTEAVAGAMVGATVLAGLFPTALVLIKAILAAFTVACLLVALFPVVAIRVQMLRKSGQDEEPTQHQIFQSLLDLHRKLDALAPPLSVALIGGTATGKAGAVGVLTEVALTGVEATASDEGAGPEEAKVEATVTASDEGVGTEGEARVEKIFLAAPLLDDEKGAALREALSRVPGKVIFTAVDGSPISIGDMERLADVFREAKWAVLGTRVGRFQEPLVDIIVEAAAEDAAHAGFVQGALKSVGIEAMGAIVPTMPQDQIEILVGNVTAKPSPSRR